jgi:hypothetical protein
VIAATWLREEITLWPKSSGVHGPKVSRQSGILDSVIAVLKSFVPVCGATSALESCLSGLSSGVMKSMSGTARPT